MDATQVAQRDPRREPVGDELSRCLGEQHLAAARETAEPRRAAEGRPEVVAVVDLRFAGVHAGTHPELDSLGPSFVPDGALELEHGVDRIGRTSERGERAVSLALRPRHAPVVRLCDVRRELVVAHHHRRHHAGMGFPEVRRALDVGEREGDDAGGHRALAGAREPLEEVGRARRPAAGVGVEGPPHDPVEPLRQIGGDAFPDDRLSRGRRRAGQREDRRRCEPVHVARAVGRPGRQLGRPVGGVDVGRGRCHPSDAEHEAEATGDADEHVLWADIGVHDRWVVPMEVIERVGYRREPDEHRAQRQARVTALEDEAPERHALDPVHHQHIGLVVEEEAVADGRDRRVRPQPEERAPVREKPVARDIRPDVADLQRHHTIVLAVDGAHDLGRALTAEDLEQLVTVPDDPPPHPGKSRGCPFCTLMPFRPGAPTPG